MSDEVVLVQHSGRIVSGAVLIVAGLLACILPTDRSNQLRVEMELLPNLFLKDTVQLRARLVDASGSVIPNAVVRFTSSDQAVVSVSETGELLAVGVGTATVTASAVGYDEAMPGQRVAQVRGLLEVDSIRPLDTRFGQTIQVFGVGLNPDSLFSVTIGTVAAQIAGFVPDDPLAPGRLGRLFVWVPPPAASRSELTILGFKGGIVFPESLDVEQQDIYEPNDTVPADLGVIPLGLRNPALAFEPRARADTVGLAADWYAFENTGAQNRTIILFSQVVGAETFGVVITDSLFWNSEAQAFGFGTQAWTIGPQTYLCGGLQVTTAGGEGFNFAEVRFPAAIVALADLPAGTYHILAPFQPPGDPASYELDVLPAYFSIASLPRDVAEENDYCDVAKSLDVANGQTLTIDNPHDVEWFQFTVPAGGESVQISVAAAAEDADLDLYIIRDLRPDTLRLVRQATTAGRTESINTTLSAGSYLLVVFDFPGVPTEYTFNATLGAPPAGAIVTDVAGPTPAELEQVRRKARRVVAPSAALLTRLREAAARFR